MKTLSVLLSLFSATQTFAGVTLAFVKPYLVIQSQLAKDTLDGVQAQVDSLTTGLKAAHLGEAAVLSQKLKNAKDIKTARDQFLALNAKLVPWFKKHPQAGTELVYCPMKKASWLQKKGDIQNPYYGAEMLECGVKEDER